MGYAVAFALSLGAGAATCIGSAIVFFPKVRSLGFLSPAISFAAGVMLYISFVEILWKSHDSFKTYFGESRETLAYDAATGSFFLGILATWLLDILVHLLQHRFSPNLPDSHDIPTLHIVADTFEVVQLQQDPDVGTPATRAFAPSKEEKGRLTAVGSIAFLAIFLHNLPEGMATFIAAAESPGLGLAFAVAVAIHNIPEGVCVSLPLYYATGSRWKGFLYGAFSGFSEPIGALIVWVILRNNGVSELMYAVLFGMVAGMMVFISVKEMLPTAHRNDPKDKYSTAALVLGMVVMAGSLMLFSV